MLNAKCLFVLVALPALAADSPEWQRVTALDAGPAAKFRTREEARTGAAGHLDLQEKALRSYLAAHPADEHLFEARLRLARLLQIRATFQGAEAARAEAARLLNEADRTAATPEQRVEVDFARLAFLMRTMRPGDGAAREQLLTATRAFQNAAPSDRRLPALLAEVATLFDRDPETQRSLVMGAQASATDPALKSRLADDLKRLDLLGQPVTVRGPTLTGHAVDLLEYRGKVVVLVFFGDFSPPSTEAITQLQRALPSWPIGAVQILGVSLDSKAEDLTAYLSHANVAWPVIFDGKAWASPLVRSLGINRLPTVWLIDRQGRLRSLNGLESGVEQVKELLKESR